MHVQSCCFANVHVNLLLFLPSSFPSPSLLLKLPIVVAHYHGNMMSHFSSVLRYLTVDKYSVLMIKYCFAVCASNGSDHSTIIWKVDACISNCGCERCSTGQNLSFIKCRYLTVELISTVLIVTAVLVCTLLL